MRQVAKRVDVANRYCLPRGPGSPMETSEARHVVGEVFCVSEPPSISRQRTFAVLLRAHP